MKIILKKTVTGLATLALLYLTMWLTTSPLLLTYGWAVFSLFCAGIFYFFEKETASALVFYFFSLLLVAFLGPNKGKFVDILIAVPITVVLQVVWESLQAT